MWTSFFKNIASGKKASPMGMGWVSMKRLIPFTYDPLILLHLPLLLKRKDRAICFMFESHANGKRRKRLKSFAENREQTDLEMFY